MSELKSYILIGSPGSGKSTWGKNMIEVNPDVTRLCPDDFRAKFGSGEGDQTVSHQAFSATKSGMKDALSNGKSVLIDATNMYRKTRKDFIDIAKSYNAETIAIVFEVDRETLIDRNQKRGENGGRNVPVHVIDNMLSKYQRPTHEEFDVIKFISKI